MESPPQDAPLGLGLVGGQSGALQPVLQVGADVTVLALPCHVETAQKSAHCHLSHVGCNLLFFRFQAKALILHAVLSILFYSILFYSILFYVWPAAFFSWMFINLFHQTSCENLEVKSNKTKVITADLLILIYIKRTVMFWCFGDISVLVTFQLGDILFGDITGFPTKRR